MWHTPIAFYTPKTKEMPIFHNSHCRQLTPPHSKQRNENATMLFERMESTKATAAHGMRGLWQEVIGPVRGGTRENRRRPET